MAKPKLIAPDKTRRRLLAGLGALGASALLGGCSSDSLSEDPTVQNILKSIGSLSQITQQWLDSPNALAREYDKSQISPWFKPNGTKNPQDPHYQQLAKNHFKDWRLHITGRVRHPARFSLAQIKAMPSRTQITRHDCVEGWSVIRQWTGVLLGHVLDIVQPGPDARYVVFYCADHLLGDPQGYYESIDMLEAYHPQTLLAYKLNGAELPIPNGAPVRLRCPRQIGYKMAKYIMHIELVNSFAHIQGGKGGFWEDRGYQWWTGI